MPLRISGESPGTGESADTSGLCLLASNDIGSASHFCAVPPERDDEPVREFASFTADLNALADWLRACGVDTVAMESTGVYWIPLHELLESRGFTVLLVNARHVRCVSGRKSDVLDCQWLQQLMTYGLLQRRVAPGRAGLRAAQPGPACAAHAKGLDADEPATDQRAGRQRGRVGPEDRSAPSWPASAMVGCWGR